MDKNIECEKCGSCCKSISINFSRKQLKEKSGTEVEFILKNWIRISKKEADSYYDEDSVKRRKASKGYYHYKCKLLTEDNLCLAHNVKHKVCKGYPFYDGLHTLLTMNFHSDCVYNKQRKSLKS